MGKVVIEERYKHIPTKYKKGHCYRNAFSWMMKYIKHHPKMLLCHGWVTGTKGPVKGVRYHHAWIEDTDSKQIVDPSLNIDDPIVIWDFIYYKIGNVDPERIMKYTFEQAIEEAEKKRSFGPWDDRYDE